MNNRTITEYASEYMTIGSEREVGRCSSCRFESCGATGGRREGFVSRILARVLLADMGVNAA